MNEFLGFIRSNKNKIVAVLLIVVAFIAGRYSVRQVTTAKVETDTVTEIQYVPKEKETDPDFDLQLPKQKLTVSVNGHRQEFKKADNERFMFDKNKLTLQQTSAADIKLTVPDMTRHWSVGVGASKNGLSGMVRFPLKNHVGGWIAGDKKNIMAGISVNF